MSSWDNLSDTDKQRALAALAFANKANGDAKTRREYLKAFKAAFPDAAVPEIDAVEPAVSEFVNPLKEQLEATNKKLAELEEQRTKEKAEREFVNWRDSGRSKARQMGYQEEGISRIEKIMEDKGIGDYEVAAAYLEKITQGETMVEPSSIGGGFDFFAPDDNDENHTLLMKSPRKFKSKMIKDTLRNMRSGQVRF